MEADESHPTVTTKKGATEEMATVPKQPPPLQVGKSDHVEKRDADEKSFEQLRTPKHANKTTGSRDDSSPSSAGGQRGFPRENDANNQKITPDRSSAGAGQQQHSEQPGQGQRGQEYYGEGYGQLRDAAQASYYARVRMMQQAQGAAPQTISPGTSGLAAAYANAPGGYSAAAYALQAGRYQQEQGLRQGDLAGYRGGQYGYQDPRYAAAAAAGYGDGSRQFGRAVAAPYQAGQHRSAHYDPRYGAQQGNFTRAVSNSFDRSTGTKGSENAGSARAPGGAPGGKVDQSTSMRPIYFPQEQGDIRPGSSASVPDDHSWGQLNQVASVDDSTLARARLADYEKMSAENKAYDVTTKEKEIRQPPSNSSSLTNSPVEAHDTAGEKPNPSPSKLAPLDSLSSVASAQEPMETSPKDSKERKSSGNGPSSPGSSNGSLDLMKCHSGSSGLLHSFPGTHGRSMSGSSFLLDNKRLMAAGEVPPAKKSRVMGAGESDQKKRDGKPSNLPTGHGYVHGMSLQDRVSAATSGFSSSATSAFLGASVYPSLDRAPSYTYSIDSVPSKEYTYPSLPPRPGSTSSSTVAPSGSMQLDAPLGSASGARDGIVGALPSWDMLHAQDSFGAGSVGAGGAPIVGNFSFSQDYPMLSASGSNLGNTAGTGQGTMNAAQTQANQQAAQQEGRHHGPPTSLLESRNQSFEGGYYHGGDHGYIGAGGARADNLASQYKTSQFPPQASSWGAASSSASTQPTHPGSTYQVPPLAQYMSSARAFSRNMMRNYSEDSAARTSPPIAGGAASGFQPPSDFVAPLPQLRRPPPQAVYIMSSDGTKKRDQTLTSKAAGGVYGWSKEEDDRLAEVLKKFKNPRDWEPIAQAHGYNKSAKECHERWIRYLKPGVRKGQWTDHEDAIVVEAVSSSTEQPFTRWSDLAQKLPGRVGKQIRDRWVNHLNPNINHMPFSKEDVSDGCTHCTAVLLQ